MNDLTFTTKIDDVDVYGLNHNLKIDDSIDIYFGNATAVIKWEVIIEAREWGIKDISALINSVEVSIPWEIFYEEDMPLSQEVIDKIVNTMGGLKHPTKKLYEGVIEINSNKEFNGANFEITNKIIGENQQSSYYPETLEVNFDDMSIEIN